MSRDMQMSMQQQRESKEVTAQIEAAKKQAQVSQMDEKKDRTKEIEEAKKKGGGAL